MMEWKETDLESLLESLIDYRGKTPQKTDRGIPLITAKIIKRGTIAEPNEFIAEENYDSWMVRGIPMAGDVVLTTEAPLGEVAQLDERKIALAQRVVCLRGKKDVLDNTYLKYYFLSAVGHKALTARETGTTVLGIKQSELRKVKVVYPPFNSQRRIASILSSLDRKIELNNKINAQLEEMAQAIFKSWFVDFEPFKVGADGSAPTYGSGKFVESELGMIPEGWRVVKLGDIIKTTSGGTPSRQHPEYYEDGDICWVKSKELVGGFVFDTEEHITETGIAKSSAKILPTNSVLIAMYGATVGEFGITSREMTCNQAICALIPNDMVPYSFLFLFAKNNKERLVNNAIGSAQQNVSQVIIKQTSVLFNEALIKKFHEITQPLFQNIMKNQAESLHLSQLRDTLLPKLMNGEIEI